LTHVIHSNYTPIRASLDLELCWFKKVIMARHMWLLMHHKTIMGANMISWFTPTPLGDGLLGVYSKIFLKYFEQKFFIILLKIFKIFITLLCYGLHSKFAKNMSLSKKFKSIYKSFHCLNTLIIMLSKYFWVFFTH